MKGKWHGKPFHDVTNNRWIISFETDSQPDVYDATAECDVEIEIKRFRERRSLNANAYFHLLVDRIAKKTSQSAIEAKNVMLERYGTVDSQIGKMLLRSDIPYLQLSELHLRATSEYEFRGETIFRAYIVIKPSHLYDSKEMSDLIDGTVEEAKLLGIETLTPEMLEQMKRAWESSQNRK